MHITIETGMRFFTCTLLPFPFAQKCMNLEKCTIFCMAPPNDIHYVGLLFDLTLISLIPTSVSFKICHLPPKIYHFINVQAHNNFPLSVGPVSLKIFKRNVILL